MGMGFDEAYIHAPDENGKWGHYYEDPEETLTPKVVRAFLRRAVNQARLKDVYLEYTVWCQGESHNDVFGYHDLQRVVRRDVDGLIMNVFPSFERQETMNDILIWERTGVYPQRAYKGASITNDTPVEP